MVNQKVWTIANAYQVMDESGQQIGLIQENLPFSRVILGFFMSKKNLPWNLQIQGMEKEVLVQVDKKFSFIKATIEIKDAAGAAIATVKQKFTLLKPEYDIEDPSGKLIAKIKGNFIGWDFVISNAEGTEIATINKKFELTMKELFTDSDKYKIEIKDPNMDENMRAIVVAASGIIDKINRETDD